MRFAPYIPLAGCVMNVALAFFFFLRSPRALASRIFLLLGLAIATWNLGSFFLFVVQDRESALFWARVVQFGVIAAMPAFVHLSLLAGQFNTRRMPWLYAFQGLLAMLCFTPWYVRDVRDLGNSGWYAISGPAFHLLNIPYAISVYSIYLLLRRRKEMPHFQKRRVTPLIIAQAILALLGINDLLPILNIDHYPGTQIPVYPYGSLAAVFYGIIIGYSVLQNQLLDIRIGLSHIAAHFIRFSFLFGISAGLLLGVALVSRQFNALNFALALAVFAISAVTAAVLFPRFFGTKELEKWESRILGDHFEYQDQVRSFITNTVWYDSLSTLFDDLHHLLTQTFRLESYQVIMREEATQSYNLYRSHPEDTSRKSLDLKPQSAVFRYFEWGKGEYLSIDRTRLRATAASLERRASEEMAAFAAQFCLPLASQSEVFGLLLVGRKLDDEPYTATDINLLVSLVKNMSLIVNQIRLKSQILQAQELDLLGRMSRGMAHDLNNLLTPVWTLLQLAGESGEGFDEELLPVAQRNIRTMRSYIKEALFFSENLRLDLQLGRVDLVIQHAVDLARASRNKKDVEVISVTAGEVLAEMDEVLMQRLIANLISNALDASRSGAQIHVHLDRLPRPGEPDWLRLRVVDQGEGIPKENLSRILKPYFTTKNRGDENRGFGLGLAICRKIVNLHGGNLSIASVVKKGTTVQVDLPSRQPRPAASPIAVSA